MDEADRGRAVRSRGAGARTLADRVRAIVAADGGDAVLLRCHAGLLRLLELRPHAVVVPSLDGYVGATYRALLDSLTTAGS